MTDRLGCMLGWACMQQADSGVCILGMGAACWVYHWGQQSGQEQEVQGGLHASVSLVQGVEGRSLVYRAHPCQGSAGPGLLVSPHSFHMLPHFRHEFIDDV